MAGCAKVGGSNLDQCSKNLYGVKTWLSTLEHSVSPMVGIPRKKVGTILKNGLDTKWAMPTSGTNCQTTSLVHCECSAGNKSIINKK